MRNKFNIFGFPTQVRPGFAVFMLLLILVYPFPLGVWVAGAVAVFTLIHELGHAFAARASACKASISLDFMVAYASYEPTRTLTWGQRAAIAISGPALQTAVGFAVLLISGVNPFSRSDISASNFSVAVWWAGIALGILNLIPLMPLDGGALVATVAEHFYPGRGKNIILKASFIVTIGIGSAMLITGYMGLLPITGLLLIMQYQSLTEKQRLTSVLQRTHEQATDDPAVNAMILDLIISNGLAEEGVLFAHNAYKQSPSFAVAFSGAISALMNGDKDLAVQWLRVAEKSQIRENELRDALACTEFFNLLHTRDDVSREWFTHG